VPDKRVLRGIFGLNSEELTAGSRTSYSEVLCGLYSSNKGEELGEECSMHGREEIFVRGFVGKKNLGFLGLDVSIILKWIFKLYFVKMWAIFIWLRIQPTGGLV
jgi:hypothetical protein